MNDKVSEREFDLLNDKVDGIAAKVDDLAKSDVKSDVRMLIDSQKSLINSVNNMVTQTNNIETIVIMQAQEQKLTTDLLDNHKDSFPFLSTVHKNSKKVTLAFLVGFITFVGAAVASYAINSPNPPPVDSVKKEKTT